MGTSSRVMCESDVRLGLRVWSLAEIMNTFSTSMFGFAMNALGRLAMTVQHDSLTNGGVFDRPKLSTEFHQEVVKSLKDVKLSSVLREQLSRIEQRLVSQDCSADEATILLREYHNNILVECDSTLFFRISEERRAHYERPNTFFGSGVDDVSRDASKDIAAAGRCLALDEWTACVFHLMRILEIGLVNLGKRVGLPENQLELQTWHVVIDRIEAKIRVMGNASKSIEKSENLQFYSKAANNFGISKRLGETMLVMAVLHTMSARL